MKLGSDKIKVGISIGDINGIGPEIILKTFSDKRMLDLCTPIIFASTKLLDAYKKIMQSETPIFSIDKIEKSQSNRLNVFNVWKNEVSLSIGKETPEGGEYAFKSLKSGVEALKSNAIDVLLTAPINKHNIQSEEFDFKGHTEYLEANLEGESLMILMCDDLKIGLITGHIPVQDIAKNITAEKIEKKILLMCDTLIKDFKISKPKIAVLGLNPHCGDNGVIGSEDEEVVRPTLERLQQEGCLVYGPFSADSFFGNKTYKNYDGVMAMYHDQGLAPFKTIAFGRGVNFTAGLDRIRTSPDHGTAYEIAGKGEANHHSFKEALYTAIDVFKARNEYQRLIENKLQTTR